MTLAIVSLAYVLTVATFCGLLTHTLRGQSRERQSWASERGTLLDRLMHATDTTWTLPPRPVEELEPVDTEAEVLVTL